MLLSRRKDDKITIEGHDEFVKYWKPVRNEVAERQKQREANENVNSLTMS